MAHLYRLFPLPSAGRARRVATTHLRALAAALVTPLWLAGDRWRELVLPSRRVSPDRAPSPGAVAAGDRVVRWLSRVPLGPWRSSCLHRSVAVCLLLRWSGVVAVLRLGVAAPAPSSGPRRPPALLAHAWIENGAGEVLYGERAGWSPLTAS